MVGRLPRLPSRSISIQRHRPTNDYHQTPRALRDELIEIPSFEDDYSRVMLVGTTGAGKTTLLRHLIGTDPTRERFPSTSTAKTTTAEFEIICAPGPFQAAVTFTPYELVRTDVDECIQQACQQALSGADDEKIAEALLEHSEQRFRLKYILGAWDQPTADSKQVEQSVFEDDWGGGEWDDSPSESEEAEQADNDRLSDTQIRNNNQQLRGFIDEIQSICKSIDNDLNDSRKRRYQEIDDSLERNDVWEEIIVPILEIDQGVTNLSNKIMSAIATRFTAMENGEFESDPTMELWKQSWYFEENNRGLFLEQLRQLTGNHHLQFGRLLTPLVNGIRVRGPFTPADSVDTNEIAKLVLLDGEGIGHTARNSDSVSTKITERFPDVDMIVLVDNAQQPMQAAPISLLRTAAQSGHGDKLALVLTHFDQVHGDNLDSPRAKRRHVYNSVTNTLAGLRDQLSARPHETISQRLTLDRVRFLADLHKQPSKFDNISISELRKLLDTMKESGKQTADIDLAPNYSLEQFTLGIRDAADSYKDVWRGKLGISHTNKASKEHWARVKAMTRRLMWGEDEYQRLLPVADLIGELQAAISTALERPESWTRDGNEQEERRIINNIQQHLSQELHAIVKRRIVNTPQEQWNQAYEERGRGSSVRRAQLINKIYDRAAPSLRQEIDEFELEFQGEIIHALREAIEREGGILDIR